MGTVHLHGHINRVTKGPVPALGGNTNNTSMTTAAAPTSDPPEHRPHGEPQVPCVPRQYVPPGRLPAPYRAFNAVQTQG